MREREKAKSFIFCVFHLLAYFPDGQSSQVWARTKSRTRNSNWVYTHVMSWGQGCPSNWDHPLLFSLGHSNRELYRKWGIWDSNHNTGKSYRVGPNMILSKHKEVKPVAHDCGVSRWQVQICPLTPACVFPLSVLTHKRGAGLCPKAPITSRDCGRCCGGHW